MDAGAVTWGSGTSGITGTISAANSLVGSTADDQVGLLNPNSSVEGVIPLSNGNYVVSSPNWDNGAVIDAGAVTWDFGASGTTGTITTANSVLGVTASSGATMVFQYDPVNNQLMVGRPADNIVTLFTTTNKIFLPLIVR